VRTFVLGRLLLTIPVIWVVSVLVFFSIRIVPVDAVEARLQDLGYATPTQLAKMRHDLGLDRPMYEQYFVWMRQVLRGDLGTSTYTGRSVASELGKAIPVTAELGFLAFAISVLLAVPIGVLSAIRQDSWLDYLCRSVSIAGISIPDFVLATLAVILPSIWWGYFAPLGYTRLWNDPARNLQQCLPAGIVLGIVISAPAMRIVRSTVLEVLREDYIRTAWAKGLRERTIVARHALRNALIPVVTVWGNQVGALLGGVVLIETIFSLPGVGRLTYTAILERDYTQIVATVLFMALVYVATNLIVDLLYGYLDPRIRYA
jgi:peptide/nickel transport system permease protein